MNTATANYNSRKAPSQVLLLLVLVLVSGSANQAYSQETYSNENLPVLRYTANSDPLNFKYDLFQNMEVTILYRGNKESGKCECSDA